MKFPVRFTQKMGLTLLTLERKFAFSLKNFLKNSKIFKKKTGKFPKKNRKISKKTGKFPKNRKISKKKHKIS